MIAMRHLPIPAARRLRRENAIGVTAAGSLPAALSLIPVVNLTVPLFATAYFVHLFKRMAKEDRGQTAGVLSG
jgi:CysZ protein